MYSAYSKRMKRGEVVQVDTYDNGNVMVKSRYINGVLNGVYQAFDEEGTMTFNGHYRNGLLHGQVMKYNRFGSVVLIEHYYNGMLNGPTISYDDDGIIKTFDLYELGKLKSEKGVCGIDGDDGSPYRIEPKEPMKDKKISFGCEDREEVEYSDYCRTPSNDKREEIPEAPYKRHRPCRLVINRELKPVKLFDGSGETLKDR